MKLLPILLLLLTACGPLSKLRRAERLINKAELLGAKWHQDTVYVNVRIPIPEVKTDTILVSAEGDTVYITKDRLKIKYVNLPGDSIFIEGECAADTVYKNVPVTVIKTIEAKCTPWWKWFLIGMGVMLVVSIIIKIVGKL